MARIKVVERITPPKRKRNKSKKKQAKEKELMIVPRLRLEPRISLNLKETKTKNEEASHPEQSDSANGNGMEENDVPKNVLHEKDLSTESSVGVKQKDSEIPISYSCITKNVSVSIQRCDLNSSGIINDNIDANVSKQAQQKKKTENSVNKIETKNKHCVSSWESRLPKFKKILKGKKEENQNFATIDEMKRNTLYNIFDFDNTAEVSFKEERNDELSIFNSSVSENDVNVEKEYKPRKKKARTRTIPGSHDWTDKELLDLITGLQAFGFNEYEKVAETVKTKNENAIREFVARRTAEARTLTNSANKAGSGMPLKSLRRCKGRPPNTFVKVVPEHLDKWPNIRKWRRMSYSQILTVSKCNDYSRSVIGALCKKFYDEEDEPCDPQVMNTKLIYKYMMDCMTGEIPAQLPPKESALVVNVLKDLKLMPQVYDFEEETQFLEHYREATKYKPFEVKDEFKKRFAKARTEDMFSPTAVSVPEEIFLNLSRHKKLVQSFNPLATPVWMVQKEQEILEKFI